MAKSSMGKFRFLFLFVFYFLIIFGIGINGVDFTYPLLGLGYIIVLFKQRRLFLQDIFWYIFFALFIGLYASFISIINSYYDFFELLRLARCVVTLTLIFLSINAFNIKKDEMWRLIKLFLFINAVVVLFTIIFPGFKNVIVFISQYKKNTFRYRSSGLLNGEDACGWFCLAGFIIETIEKIVRNKSFLSIKVIIYLASFVFISRITLVFAAIYLFFLLLFAVKKKSWKNVFQLLLLIIPSALAGVVVLALTTGLFDSLRGKLLELSFFSGLYQTMVKSGYLDYGNFDGMILSHFDISFLSLDQALFGAGSRSIKSRDVGYVKTIMSCGILGILFEIVIYLWMAKKVFRMNKNNYVSYAFAALIIQTFAWEFKMSFIFASGYFELTMCLFFASTNKRDALFLTNALHNHPLSNNRHNYTLGEAFMGARSKGPSL